MLCNNSCRYEGRMKTLNVNPQFKSCIYNVTRDRVKARGARVKLLFMNVIIMAKIKEIFKPVKL